MAEKKPKNKTKEEKPLPEAEANSTEKEQPIESEEDKKARKNRGNKFFAGMIAGIIILILAVALYPKLIPKDIPNTIEDKFEDLANGNVNEEQFIYNDYSVVSYDGLWYTKVGAQGKTFTIPLHFSPKEVENIEFEGSIGDFVDYLGKHPLKGHRPAAYTTFDPTIEAQNYTALANAEFVFNTIQTLGLALFPGCIKNETDGCRDVEIIQCNNTNATVIFLDQTGESGVKIDNNCVIMSGDGFDLVRSVDRFLYSLYGVMPETQA